LVIGERDQIAGDSQIANLAWSPKNNSLTAQITLQRIVLFFIIYKANLTSYLKVIIEYALTNFILIKGRTYL
jgi:hypothetical protein